jgi:DNA-binding NtrC family response regulator
MPYLIQAFLTELERTSGKSNLKITPEATARLQRYPWPGNVRELKNVVESMVLMTEGNILNVDNLPQNIRGSVNAKEIKFPVGVTMEEAEKEIIRRYLECFPTKKQAAHALRIGLRTLHHKVKKFGLLAV